MKFRIFVIVLISLLSVFAAGTSAQTTVTTILGQDVSFKTSDNTEIYGTLYRAQGASSAVILLHMLGRTKADWKQLALPLRDKGITCLAIDLRGHGQSINKAGGKIHSLGAFTKKDFTDMQLDVAAAVDFLKSEKIKKDQIVIVGASIGANVGINFAADNPDRIRGVAMISPGMEYRGVATESAMKTYKKRVFLVASKGDKYSAKTVGILSKIQPDRCVLKIFSDSRHGTALFTNEPELAPMLIDWVTNTLKK